MIPFNFEYYRPDSSEQAVMLFEDLDRQGKRPLYYGGGTEIISFSRLYQLYPGAVIDLKGIPECNTLELKDGNIIIGVALTLTKIQESNIFPLLSHCGGRVADHTVRNKITLGGNICAKIPYRETVLALLVSDAGIVIQGKDGKRKININEVFNQFLHLKEGEILLQAIIDEKVAKLPFASYKTTVEGEVGYPQDKIGYPVVSAAAIKDAQKIRFAVSGVCNYPIRSPEVENALGDTGTPWPERVEKAVEHLPVISDMEGSAGYRKFVLENILHAIQERLD